MHLFDENSEITVGYLRLGLDNRPVLLLAARASGGSLSSYCHLWLSHLAILRIVVPDGQLALRRWKRSRVFNGFSGPSELAPFPILADPIYRPFRTFCRPDRSGTSDFRRPDLIPAGSDLCSPDQFDLWERMLAYSCGRGGLHRS